MTAPSREDQLRRLIVEQQLMEDSAETLQQRLQILQTAIADLLVAKTSIEALKESEKGDPILVPTGGGTYVNANLGDLNNLIVNIGADVAIEMGLEEAEKDISGRLEDVEKASRSVQQQLGQILAQMEIHRDRINRLGAELRGEAPGV